MPLWDSLRRQVEMLPGVSAYDAVNDFAPIVDASEGVIAKIALKDLRSKELISVPMFTSRTLAPPTTTSAQPLRVLRAPYALRIERIYATCDVAGTGTVGFDVMKNSLNLWAGASTPASNVVLNSGIRVNSEVPTTTDFAEMDEFRFHCAQTNTAMRVPWLHVLCYRI